MITSTTKCTKKIFADFATFTVKKNKAMTYIYICAAIIILCSIILLSLNEISQGILYLCLGLFFALYGVLVRGLIILSNKKNVDTINVFLFEDTKFTISVVSKEGKEIANSTINYEALHSVKTYKNYAYIYVNKVSCYIILKENFKDENEFNSVVENIQSQVGKINNNYASSQTYNLKQQENDTNKKDATIDDSSALKEETNIEDAKLIERAEVELDKVKKDNAKKIKTAEDLMDKGVINNNEMEKVKQDCEDNISNAEEKLNNLKSKCETSQNNSSNQTENEDDEKYENPIIAKIKSKNEDSKNQRKRR